jgi:hypothetical protein
MSALDRDAFRRSPRTLVALHRSFPHDLANVKPDSSSKVVHPGSHISIENSPLAAFAHEELDMPITVAKKRARHALPLNFRAWSTASGVDDRCNIYTIRAFLGDPDFPLPGFVRNFKINVLHNVMRSAGFVDISGNKDALMRRFQTEVPFVEYRIDGRECLQRMLVVCLDSWGYSDLHLFRATMPARGGCHLGTKRLRDLDSLSEMKFWGRGKKFLHHFKLKCEREKWMNHKLKNKGAEVDRATLEALLDGRTSFHDRAPFRTIEGTGFEPGVVGKGFCSNEGGALTLDECQLIAGDRVSMLYDFGASNTIVFKIVKVDGDQQLLPEVAILRSYATRTHVDRRGGYPLIGGSYVPSARERINQV